MNGTDLRNQRILVTGAAGFVGFHLTERLLAAGAEVHGLDNINNYYDVRLKEARLARLSSRDRFAFERADITDDARVRNAFERFKPDYVVHLAAQAGVRYSLQNPKAYTQSNVDGFVSILEACRAHPVRHLVYASSSSVYGANAKVPFTETDRVEYPVSLYAATKRANELMAHAYAHLFRIPASGLRFFTIYGPWGRPDMAYFSFTKSIIEGRPIDVFNDGRMKRDFTYVDDAVEAIERLIALPPAPTPCDDPTLGDPSTGPVPHRIYNIGNHTPVELGRFIAAIEAAVGRKAERRLLPMQPGDVPETYADVARLEKAVGFLTRTQIEDGISRFVSWYRDYTHV